MERQNNYLMVAALDFGTTYSGYAFSMRHEFKIDPLKIHANQAWGSARRTPLTLKTPTTLLLDDKKQLVAFGYDAENRYPDIVMDDKQDDYFYFHRFKMNLHNNKNITLEMELEDLSGKSVPAIDVFALLIKALKDHLMDHLKKQGTGVKKEEIRWVLTVPAIWTDNAKQFMRKSAEKAGISSDQLVLALEPEAASIFCQYLPTEKIHGTDQGFTMAASGTKYMVVDLGGGTADITVHEKQENGNLKEICRATGNDCGGMSVDSQFFQLFVKILGGPLMITLKKQNPSAYLALFWEFEAVKRNITPVKSGKITFTIPYIALDQICKSLLQENLQCAIESSPYSSTIYLRGDKMRADAELMKNLFKPTINRIVEVMNDILSDTSAEGVTYLLMVGGFAECLLIREAVQKAFPTKRIINPEESWLSVLKGAVLFGHRPDYVQSRVMRFSYGLLIFNTFDQEKHDKKYLVNIEGVEKCDKIFDKIIEKGQIVTAGTVVEKEYCTIRKMQKIMNFDMFVANSKAPMYTDDENCTHIGAAEIILPNPCLETRYVDVKFVFGNTEISMTAVDRNSGHSVTALYNLIQQDHC